MAAVSDPMPPATRSAVNQSILMVGIVVIVLIAVVAMLVLGWQNKEVPAAISGIVALGFGGMLTAVQMKGS